MSEEKKIEPTYEFVIGDDTIKVSDNLSAQKLAKTLIEKDTLTFTFWTIREKARNPQ